MSEQHYYYCSYCGAKVSTETREPENVIIAAKLICPKCEEGLSISKPGLSQISLLDWFRGCALAGVLASGCTSSKDAPRAAADCAESFMKEAKTRDSKQEP